MKSRLISILKKSERYTKTDMVYFTSGAFWGNFSAVTVMILALVASVFFARFMTKDAYGTYQYVLSIAGLIGALTLTGMNSAVTRAVARGHEGEFKHSVRYQIIAGIVPTLLGLCIAIWYLAHGNHGLAAAFACVAIFLPLGNAYNTWMAYTGGKKLFRVGSYYGLANNLFTYVPIILAIYFARDFLWVVFANYFFVFLSGFVIYHVIIRKIPPNEKLDNETMSYGTHLSFMGILGTFANQLDSLLIFHFIGAAELAVYSFATIIPERLAGMIKFIPGIAFMKLAEKSEGQVRRDITKKLWVLAGIVAVTAAVYSILAPWVFRVLFPAYAISIPLTQLYSLSFFSLIPAYVQTALTAQQKIKKLYTLNLVAPIIRATLLIVFMFYYGIWGLLWAQIINNFVSLAFQLMILWRKPTAQII